MGLLVVPQEVGFVLDDGPAQGSAPLLPVELRVLLRVNGISRVDSAGTIEEEDIAMKLVRTTPGDGVDHAGEAAPKLGRESVGDHLHLFHHVKRERTVGPGQVASQRANLPQLVRDTVGQDVQVPDPLAVQGHLAAGAPYAHGPGRQAHVVEEVAPLSGSSCTNLSSTVWLSSAFVP